MLDCVDTQIKILTCNENDFGLRVAALAFADFSRRLETTDTVATNGKKNMQVSS